MQKLNAIEINPDKRARRKQRYNACNPRQRNSVYFTSVCISINTYYFNGNPFVVFIPISYEMNLRS